MGKLIQFPKQRMKKVLAAKMQEQLQAEIDIYSDDFELFEEYKDSNYLKQLQLEQERLIEEGYKEMADPDYYKDEYSYK